MMNRRNNEQPPHKSPPTDEAREELGPKNREHPVEHPSDDAVRPDPQHGVTIGKDDPTRRWGDAQNITRDDTPLD